MIRYLGIDEGETVDPLRAHQASNQGRYGRGPMGTGFVLVNSDFERRIAVLAFPKRPILL